MKKLLLILFLFISLTFTTCSPKVYYFSQETLSPQEVVDSLTNHTAPYYQEWASTTVMGVNKGDSTLISTYVYSQYSMVGYQIIAVTDWGNEAKSLVREQRQGKK